MVAIAPPKEWPVTITPTGLAKVPYFLTNSLNASIPDY